MHKLARSESNEHFSTSRMYFYIPTVTALNFTVRLFLYTRGVELRYITVNGMGYGYISYYGLLRVGT